MNCAGHTGRYLDRRTTDDYQDIATIDKITVGDRDLHEGWNVAYFEDIIHEEVLAGEDYHWTDHGD